MAQMGKEWSVVALLLCAGGAGATEEVFWPQGYKLAGEIIVAPAPSSGKSSSEAATANRERARSYNKPDGTPAPGTTVIIVPEEEDGLLSPRGGESLPSNRAKAREYQSGSDSRSQPQILIVPGRDPAKVEPSHERAEANRSKARSYMKGETPVGVAGADGLPVVNCRDVDSVSGRIGDDTRSGGVISVFQNGRQVKVRCK